MLRIRYYSIIPLRQTPSLISIILKSFRYNPIYKSKLAIIDTVVYTEIHFSVSFP